MIIVQGQAKVRQHPTFQASSIHSIVAIVNTSSDDEARKRIKDELTVGGFGEIRLFRFAEVTVWRAIFLNEQGRNLRAAFFRPVVSVFSDEDGGWHRSDA